MVDSALGDRGVGTRRGRSVRWFVPLVLLPALAGCQFSFSSGGIDYENLESAITAELNGEFAEISRQVSSVDCPRDGTPGVGDSFTCVADLEGHPVRVGVTVLDEDHSVDFRSLDAVVEPSNTAAKLADDISAQYGFDITVTCGEDLTVIAIGDSFECAATDPTGETRTVTLTPGPAGEDDSWAIVN